MSCISSQYVELQNTKVLTFFTTMSAGFDHIAKVSIPGVKEPCLVPRCMTSNKIMIKYGET